MRPKYMAPAPGLLNGRAGVGAQAVDHAMPLLLKRYSFKAYWNKGPSGEQVTLSNKNILATATYDSVQLGVHS